MDDKLIFLDIEEIDPPKEAARDLIDPEQVRELAESIRGQGLLQPIVVRPINGRYEVVCGHRRFLAHRLLGEVKIKSIIREMTEDEVDVIRTIENDQREDLNPIEKAKSYRKLREKYGLTVEEIAKRVGRNRDTIHRFLSLLKMPEILQDAVAKKKMSIGVALTLNEIDDEEWRRLYYPAAIENGATVEVAQSWVNEYRKFKGQDVGGYGGGMGGQEPLQESLPIYQPCFCCTGPVEISKIRTIYVCRECESQVRGALKPQ